jgi:hypothetical protein
MFPTGQNQWFEEASIIKTNISINRWIYSGHYSEGQNLFPWHYLQESFREIQRFIDLWETYDFNELDYYWAEVAFIGLVRDNSDMGPIPENNIWWSIMQVCPLSLSSPQIIENRAGHAAWWRTFKFIRWIRIYTWQSINLYTSSFQRLKFKSTPCSRTSI